MDLSDPTRFTLQNVAHPWAMNMYVTGQSVLWTLADIKTAVDVDDWKKLPENEKKFIKMILAFFACTDGIVNENIALNFLIDSTAAEIRLFYGLQMYIEGVHQETYSMFIKLLAKDAEEIHKLSHAISEIPIIESKSRVIAKWTSRKLPMAERLVAFAFIEGVLFSSSFCGLGWLKQRGVMPGLTFSNELISKDEGLHALFSCHYVTKTHLKETISKERIIEIGKEFVEIEQQYVDEALPVNLIQMNATSMKKYVEFVADHLFGLLECGKVYKTPNPFGFMDMISVMGKTNFFEKSVSEYSSCITADFEFKDAF